MSITHEPRPATSGDNEWSDTQYNGLGHDTTVGPTVEERVTGENREFVGSVPGEASQPVAASVDTGLTRRPDGANASTAGQIPATESRKSMFTRRRLVAGGLAVAVLGAGIGIGAAASGGSSKPRRETATSAPVVPGRTTASSKPSSITPSHEATTSKVNGEQASVKVVGAIDMTTVNPGEAGRLNVGEPQVPAYNLDPSVNPLAAFSATLADYSYGLGATQEADAATARNALALNQTTQGALISVRQLWKSIHQDEHPWFWTKDGQPLHITTHLNKDGTLLTLTATGDIHVAAVANAADGSWEAPDAGLLQTDGTATIHELRFTYRRGDTSNPNSPHTELVGSQVDGRGSDLSFPIVQ